MAWEEESIEGGADFEEVGGKKSPLKMILIILVGLAVAGGIGYAVWKFLLNKDPAAEKPEGEKAEEVIEEVVADKGFKVDLEKFTLNLASTGGGVGSFLVAKLALEVDTEQLKIDLTDPEDKELYMIKTRDVVLKVLRSKTTKEISDPEILKEVSKEILFKLNREYKSGKARNVYFSELLVQ